MPIHKARLALAGLLAAAICTVTISANAASPQLTIELNKLDQKNDACRLTLLIKNGFEKRIEKLDLELVLFGKDSRIIKLIAVPAGSFPRNKTRVRQFDLAETKCASIGRILLNTITNCSGPDLAADICLEHTKTRSTTSVDLTY